MATTVELLKAKEEKIRVLQEKKSRLEGKREQLLKDLKSKFGISSVEEGQALLAKKKEKLSKFDDDIKHLMDEMDEIIEGAQNG